jgi:hypothetical protein
MATPYSQSLLSALSGGAAAVFFAPMLWPIVVFAEQGGFSDMTTFLVGLLTVAGVALVGGILLGLLVGFPLLLLLQRWEIANPIVVVAVGAIASAIVFSGFLSWPVSAWPLYSFFAVVGGLCGWVAAWRMRSNFHHTRPPAPAAGEF